MKRALTTVGVFGLVLFPLVGVALGQLSDEDIAALRERGTREGWTFEVGPNPATRYPLHQLCGFLGPEVPPGESLNEEPPAPNVLLALPASFDWRQLNGCTSIKNQGSCGSCWAFATVGVLECAIKIREALEVDLSEQWLVSCVSEYFGCNGGWEAHNYHLVPTNPKHRRDACGGVGAVLESVFPYRAEDLPCGCPYEHTSYFLLDWGYVGSGGGVPPVPAMKQAIMEYGPIFVAVAVGNSFAAYRGGVFNDYSATSINHAVVLVGWDDTQGTNGVWFLRNSWGPWWGEYGYMRIEYGCSFVGYRASWVDYYTLPVIQEIPNRTALVGRTYTESPRILRGTRPITWTLEAGPPGATFSPDYGTIVWTNPGPINSVTTVRVRASNLRGSDVKEWTVTVKAAPVIADIPDKTITIGARYVETPTLLEGSLPVTWRLIRGPAGMTVDSNTGVVTWEEPNATGSPFPVTLLATNEVESDDESWVLTVKAPPVIAPIADEPNLPAGKPYTKAVTLVQGSPPITWSLLNGPPGMTIDPAGGTVSWPEPNATGGPVTVTARATNEVGNDTKSWAVTVKDLPVIVDIPNRSIAVGQEYTETPTLLRGTPPVTWSLVGGPAGMTVDPTTGVVRWPAPTTTGSPFTVVLRATNAVGYGEETWQLTVKAAPVISDIPDRDVILAQTYTETPTLVQGSPPVTWTLQSGPVGMSIDPNTGAVTWANPGPVNSNHTVRIRAANDMGAAEESWQVRVFLPTGPPVIRPVPDRAIVFGQTYGESMAITQGTLPVTWTLLDGPAGMTIDSGTGAVLWPSAGPRGSLHTLRVRATNAVGSAEVSWQLSVVLPPGPPRIDEIPDQSIPAGQPYNETPSLSQGTSPVTWVLITGPPGMTVNSTTGAVAWPAPTATSTPVTVTIRASNAQGQDDESWRLTVTAPPTAPEIRPFTNQTIRAGAPYVGPEPALLRGTRPVTWMLVSGPAGMTIDSTTGVVSWPSPTHVGSPFTVTLKVENAAGSDQKSWSLSVLPPFVEVFVSISPADVGLRMTVDGVTYSGLQKFNWEMGSSHSVSVTTPQVGQDGLTYHFESWSDGNTSSTRTLGIGSTTSYTATMRGVAITALTITGPATIQENTSAQYALRVTRSDGSSEDMTAGAEWRLSSDYGASITGPGRVTARDVQADWYCEVLALYGGTSARLPIAIVKTPDVRSLTVSTSPAGSGAPVKSAHNQGEVVMVPVPDPPAEGMVFAGWTGDASGTENPLRVVMDRDRTVVAVFTKSNGSTPLPAGGCGTGVPAAAVGSLGVMLLLRGVAVRRRR